MPVVTASGEVPFDDDDWRGLARGEGDAQNRLIARFSPELHLKFEANIHSAELRATAEEETFRRVFSFFLSGRECSDEASLAEFINGISRNVMMEFQRAEYRWRSAE